MGILSFSTNSVSIPVPGGSLNGFKVNTVMHSGRKVDVSARNYFYVPYARKFVRFSGSETKQLCVSNGKYNLSEPLPHGLWVFRPDARRMHEDAEAYFG